jgi:hypothetical protein
MQPETECHRHAGEILHDREQRAGDEEHHHLFAADAQQPDAGGKAQRGEERDHEGLLQRGVELERGQIMGASGSQRDGDGESAQHGRGNIEAAQSRDQPAEPIPEEQHQARERDAADQADLQRRPPDTPQRRGSVVVPSLPCSSRKHIWNAPMAH